MSAESKSDRCREGSIRIRISEGELQEPCSSSWRQGIELAPLAVFAAINPHAALAELAAASGSDGVPGALGLAVRAELWGVLDTLTDDDARGRSQRDVAEPLAKRALPMAP